MHRLKTRNFLLDTGWYGKLVVLPVNGQQRVSDVL
jgi:hypothetical protein